MKVPIFCFDLDGTLLDPNEKIHPNDIEILNTITKGVFIPCTGRPLDSVESMFRNNGLFNIGPIPFAMVTQNGSAVHKPGGEVYQYHSFPRDVQDRLLDIFELFPDATFMLMEQDRNLLMHPGGFGIQWMERFRTPWFPYDESCRECAFGKATCISDDIYMFKNLSEHLKDLPLEFGISMSSIFDINPKGISKRTGVLSLLKYLEMQDYPIFAAGDGENDLDLFKLAQKTFTPTTSPLNVRQQTDIIVDMTHNGILASMLEAAIVEV